MKAAAAHARTCRASPPAGARQPWAVALDSALGHLVEIPAALLVVAEIIILFSGIVARYVLHTPLVWSDELASILFLSGWAMLVGHRVPARRTHAHGRAGQPRLARDAAMLMVAVAAALALLMLQGKVRRQGLGPARTGRREAVIPAARDHAGGRRDHASCGLRRIVARYRPHVRWCGPTNSHPSCSSGWPCWARSSRSGAANTCAWPRWSTAPRPRRDHAGHGGGGRGAGLSADAARAGLRVRVRGTLCHHRRAGDPQRVAPPRCRWARR